MTAATSLAWRALARCAAASSLVAATAAFVVGCDDSSAPPSSAPTQPPSAQPQPAATEPAQPAQREATDTEPAQPARAEPTEPSEREPAEAEPGQTAATQPAQTAPTEWAQPPSIDAHPVMRMDDDWIARATFLGTALPWLPGISNRPCEMIDYDGISTVARTRTLTYDEAGRLVRVRSQAREDAQLERDDFCLHGGWTDVVMTYEGRWCVEYRHRNVGPPICAERDEAGITGWSNDEDIRATVQRDRRGRPRRIEDSFSYGEGTSTTTMTYDADGRLRRSVRVTDADSGYSEDTSGYVYDERGHLAELSRTTQTRFAEGEALTVVTHRTRFSYDGEGRLSECNHDGGRVIYQYDDQGRLNRRSAMSDRGEVIAQTELRYECGAPPRE